MIYNKLVRDKIPEIIKNDGKTVYTHKAHDKEYFEKLKDKLLEEVREYIKSPCKEELADILEVVYALCDVMKISKGDLEKFRELKEKDKGKFLERIILEKVNE